MLYRRKVPGYGPPLLGLRVPHLYCKRSFAIGCCNPFTDSRVSPTCMDHQCRSQIMPQCVALICMPQRRLRLHPPVTWWDPPNYGNLPMYGARHGLIWQKAASIDRNWHQGTSLYKRLIYLEDLLFETVKSKITIERKKKWSIFESQRHSHFFQSEKCQLVDIKIRDTRIYVSDKVHDIESRCYCMWKRSMSLLYCRLSDDTQCHVRNPPRGPGHSIPSRLMNALILHI